MGENFFILVYRENPDKPLYWCGSILRFKDTKDDVRGYARKASAENGMHRILIANPELRFEFLKAEPMQ